MVVLITGRAAPAVAVTGYLFVFPFFFTNMEGQQTCHIVHSLLSVFMTVAMLAHIHISSNGMDGACDAMGTGQVDLNWAKQHHGLWVQEEIAKGRTAAPPPGAKASGAD